MTKDLENDLKIEGVIKIKEIIKIVGIRRNARMTNKSEEDSYLRFILVISFYMELAIYNQEDFGIWFCIFYLLCDFDIFNFIKNVNL